jgi:hypothetical protein
MTTFRNRWISAAAAALLAASAGMAQQQPGGAPSHVRSSSDAEGPVISIDYKGGTLGDFVASLRNSTKEPVNISLQGGADKIPVSALNVRNVSVETALQAALGPRINQQQMNADGTAAFIMFNEISGGGGGLPVYCVAVQGSMGPPRVPSADRVEVYSIQRLITGDNKISPDVVLTAIDTGLALEPGAGASKPQIKFHPDSGLILIRGEAADVRLAGDIVNRMVNDHEQHAKDAARRRAAEIDRTARMRRLEIEGRMAEADLAAAKARLDQLNKLADAGQVSGDERARAQADVMKAQAQLEIVRVEMQRLKDEADAGLAAGGDDQGGDGKADPRDAMIAELQKQVTDLKAQLDKLKGGGKAAR